MTNREELLNTNEYDLLLRIQSYMDSGHEVPCVIDAVSNYDSYNLWECPGDCDKCIQQWLDAKTKNGGKL